MRIEIHLAFNGDCQKAFEFYQRVLGGELRLFTFGESPAAEQVPAEWQSKIVHGSFIHDGIEIAGADVLAEDYETPQGFHLILQMEDQSKAKNIFSAFSENGTVKIPMEKTFWSPCYGMVVDQFGVSWEINCAEET